jgi:peroxiredoxin
MVVNNGKIEKIFIESDFEENYPTDPFKVLDADTMLNYLKSV